MAEVQINEPIEKKPTTPPAKPKSEGNYTNPEQPPTYTKEQTIIEEKPKNNVTPNSNKNQASSGKVYIDGFGYVEKAGQTKTQTGAGNTTTVPLPGTKTSTTNNAGATNSRVSVGGISFDPVPKPSTTPLITTPPKTENQTKTGGMPLTITYGRSAKNKMKNIFSIKSSSPFDKNIFDDIDEKDIEKNLPLAESTINSNIERGLLPKDYEKKFPYMKDGFAVS